MDVTNDLGNKIITAETNAAASIVPAEASLVSIANLLQGFASYQNGFNITISVTPKPLATPAKE